MDAPATSRRDLRSAPRPRQPSEPISLRTIRLALALVACGAAELSPFGRDAIYHQLHFEIGLAWDL
jgi:hypothetical protein